MINVYEWWYNFTYYFDNLNENWEYINLLKETGTVYFDFTERMQNELGEFKLKANILYKKH